jgi:hypothetical protein
MAKLYDEIKIAGFRIKIANSGGTKQIETRNMMLLADSNERFEMILDD